MTTTDKALATALLAAARACHEANRAYCLALGDASQPSWEDAPTWQRDSELEGVLGVVEGNGPEESHAGWLKKKNEEGWIYGAYKDAKKKEHPCMVSYDELPIEQRAKDAIFVAVARAMFGALGVELAKEEPKKEQGT